LFLNSKFYQENISNLKVFYIEKENYQNYYLGTKLDYYYLKSNQKIKKLNRLSKVIDADLVETLSLLED
jgi:hypothetical protein